MNLPNTEPINDPGGLWELQLQLLAISESYFGTRESFRVFHPQFCKNGPNIRIECAPRGAYAQLSYCGRFYWPTVVYELAHETVHLLNPVKKSEINYLEEGVAVAFSIYVQQRFGVKEVQIPSFDKPDERQYAIALKWVNALPHGAVESAGRIRREIGRFSAVSTEDLLKIYPPPALDPAIANALTTSFTGRFKHRQPETASADRT